MLRLTMARDRTNMICTRGGSERSAAPISTQVTIGTVAGRVIRRTTMAVNKMGTDDEPKEVIVKRQVRRRCKRQLLSNFDFDNSLDQKDRKMSCYIEKILH